MWNVLIYTKDKKTLVNVIFKKGFADAYECYQDNKKKKNNFIDLKFIESKEENK